MRCPSRFMDVQCQKESEHSGAHRFAWTTAQATKARPIDLVVEDLRKQVRKLKSAYEHVSK